MRKQQKMLALGVSVCLLIVLVVTSLAGCASQGTVGPSDTESSPSEPQAKVYNLKFQDYISRAPAIWWMQEEMKERMERASNGQLQIKLYAAGELVSSAEILGAVASGTVDFGRGMGQYWEEVKLGPIEGGLPFSWTSTDEAQKFYREDYMNFEELLRQEYAEHGAYHIGPSLILS